ncbi:MAG: metallophosphoesterase family protein [Tannerellaceae bacterium]
MAAAGVGTFSFAEKPVLKFNSDKKFKIVQFTDLHVKWQEPKSDIAFERINQVLDDEKPDLVIFTGDIIYSKPATDNLRRVLKTVSDRKTPFAIVFGNHDNEQGAEKDELLRVAQSLPYNLTEDEVPALSGVANYTLTLRSSDGTKEAAVLYCFDSNAYSSIEGIKGYDYIKTDQINWYRARCVDFAARNAGRPLPSLAFFHIPLPEYNQAATDENAALYGIRREKACSPELNSGLFTAMKENGDIMGTFVGHDHDNDYAVYWKGILLAYGRFSGGPTEYNNLPNGARIIEMTESTRTFRTWIRTQHGTEQLTIYPYDYLKK